MSRSLITLALHALCIAILTVKATPTPGRIPKVYNALITSNQNLEPSKAYPVYQPVLQDPFFPYQAVYYPTPEFRNIYPALKGAPQPQSPPAAASDSVPITNAPPEDPADPAPSEPPTLPPQANDNAKNEEENKIASGPPPPPPNTESPIPLNQFGLPPQVLPLGMIDPAYNGYNQIAPHFSYSYPGFRLYDPYYDPFSWNPYLNLPPTYRPLPNGLGGIPSFPGLPPREAGPAPSAPAVTAAPAAPAIPAPASSPTDQEPSSPPPEPENLNVLNYASKDPAIPNVPPPPLPEGGLKTNSE